MSDHRPPPAAARAASPVPLIAAAVTLSVVFLTGIVVLLPDRIAPAEAAARMAWVGD